MFHYTSGGAASAIAAAGFNLQDLQYRQQADALPSGMQALVWLGETSGVTQSFISKVQPFIGCKNLFGFRICDEPDITGRYHPQVTPANLKAMSDYIHANVPGAKTYVVLMDMGTFEAPNYMNTFNYANTGLDLFGIDCYPVRGSVFDLSYIDRTVKAAVAAGIPVERIVPVFQAFGGGTWTTTTAGKTDTYVLPTPDQARQMFDRWASVLAPNIPVFDHAYAWGEQSGDTALGSASAGNLRAAYLAHNTAVAPVPPALTVEGQAATQTSIDAVVAARNLLTSQLSAAISQRDALATKIANASAALVA